MNEITSLLLIIKQITERHPRLAPFMLEVVEILQTYSCDEIQAFYHEGLKPLDVLTICSYQLEQYSTNFVDTLMRCIDIKSV